MAALRVVAFGAIGDFPRINIRIFVVVNQALDRAVKMDNVGITYLLPSPAALRHRAEMHTPDVGGCHLTPLGCRSTVKYEILELSHCRYPIPVKDLKAAPGRLPHIRSLLRHRHPVS